MEGEAVAVLFVLALFIFAGIAILWMAMGNRRLLREMEHRERLAMIQRGLMPAPETDPLGFEEQIEPVRSDGMRKERWRTAGLITMGLGVALILLISFAAGEGGVALGIGGAFLALGAAFLLNAMQMAASAPPGRPRTRPLPRSSVPPSEPPPTLT